MEAPAQAPPGDSVAAGADLVPLHPRVRRLWWVRSGLTVLWMTILAGVVDRFAPIPLPPWTLPGVVLAVGVPLAVLGPVLRYARWRYAVRATDLWIRQGVVWVTVTVVPFSRLQFVDTRQGPLDRLFRLAELVVHTAALGTSARLPGLDVDEAERLRERLAQVEDDGSAV
jgi:membrane protein YdbS with pleckstrin-like domain